MSREDWKIKPKVKFEVEKELWTLLPTFSFMPWKYRYPDTYVIVFQWLIFAIGFGLWTEKKRHADDSTERRKQYDESRKS